MPFLSNCVFSYVYHLQQVVYRDRLHLLKAKVTCNICGTLAWMHIQEIKALLKIPPDACGADVETRKYITSSEVCKVVVVVNFCHQIYERQKTCVDHSHGCTSKR